MKLITVIDFDWDSVIEQCLSHSGNRLTYTHSSFPNTKEFRELDKMWQDAGYEHNSPSIEWINYFPEVHFDKKIVNIFEDSLDRNLKPWMVWISRIRPGKMAPWHYDAHQHIDEFKKYDNPVRYTCYIQEPTFGHVSIVDDVAIYKPKRGSIYEWPSYDAWHCGMNGGFADKFMFNYWGYV